MKQSENYDNAMKGRLVQEVTRLGHELQFTNILMGLWGCITKSWGVEYNARAGFLSMNLNSINFATGDNANFSALSSNSLT
jgi:hypothetical protein